MGKAKKEWEQYIEELVRVRRMESRTPKELIILRKDVLE
jgi:hypothetical protein